MRGFLINLIFCLHFSIVAFWLSLFFIPESWWPNKIAFHLYLSLVIASHQIIWGIILIPWTRKFRMVCVLTTLMQFLRGKSISDPENYNHLFWKEFFGAFGIIFTHQMAGGLTLIILLIASLRYFFR